MSEMRIILYRKAGKLYYQENKEDCRACDYREIRGYFVAHCGVTDDYVGDRSDATNPIPESCPFPKLTSTSSKFIDLLGSVVSESTDMG